MTCNTKKIFLEGQSIPYFLRVNDSVQCKVKICNIEPREMVVLTVMVNDIYIPLKYHDDYNLYFSGSGCLVKKLAGTDRILVYDEYDTINETVYIFERHETCFWVERSYSGILHKSEVPQNPAYVFAEERVIWRVFSKEIIEERPEAFYRHVCSQPKWAEGESFDISTDTDYKFFLRSGRLWVTYPNCKLVELKDVTKTKAIMRDQKTEQ